MAWAFGFQSAADAWGTLSIIAKHRAIWIRDHKNASWSQNCEFPVEETPWVNPYLRRKRVVLTKFLDFYSFSVWPHHLITGSEVRRWNVLEVSTASEVTEPPHCAVLRASPWGPPLLPPGAVAQPPQSDPITLWVYRLNAVHTVACL